MRKTEPKVKRSAYTLVEVLIVVTIIGIASAVIVPRMLAAGTLGIQAAARMVIADMLIAQNEAIAKQETRKVIFDAATNSYRVTTAGGTTITAPWRTGSQSGLFVVDFDTDDRFGGVALENVDFGGGQELVFDALGAPTSGGQVELVFRNQRYRISVSEFTGKVTIQQIDGG